MEGTNGSDEIEPALGASTGVFVLLWVATLIGWISTLFLWRHCSKQNSLHHKYVTVCVCVCVLLPNICYVYKKEASSRGKLKLLDKLSTILKQ